MYTLYLMMMPLLCRGGFQATIMLLLLTDRALMSAGLSGTVNGKF